VTTASPDIAEFTRLPGDRHSEVSRTLVEPVPQALSFIDQLGLWGNLGVSLLGFTGAIFVLQPHCVRWGVVSVWGRPFPGS